MQPKRPTAYTDHTGRKCAIYWRSLKGSGHRYVDGGNITISTRRNTDWQASTLLHELLHAAASRNLVVDDPTGGLEECIVGALERNLSEMWRRNPELFSWIHHHLTNGEKK